MGLQIVENLVSPSRILASTGKVRQAARMLEYRMAVGGIVSARCARSWESGERLGEPTLRLDPLIGGVDLAGTRFGALL